MAYKVGFSVELIDRRELEPLLEVLAAVLEPYARGVREFGITHEVKGMRGSTKVVEKVKFEPGEDIDLAEFGIPAMTPLELLIEGAKSPETAQRRSRDRVLDAIDNLRPRDGDGLSSVSLSAGGKVVELLSRAEERRRREAAAARDESDDEQLLDEIESGARGSFIPAQL